MISQIDIYLLNKVQQISDRIQDWSGINNFLLAKTLSAVCVILYALRSYFETLAVHYFEAAIGFFLGMVIVSFPSLIFYAQEKYLKQNPGFGNPAAIMLSRIRAIFLVLSFVFFVFNIPNIMSSPDMESPDYYDRLANVIIVVKEFIYLVFIYFGCCTPKPKKPSKIKQFLKKAIENVKSIATGTVSPDPALG